jgi:hypothetical protein
VSTPLDARSRRLRSAVRSQEERLDPVRLTNNDRATESLALAIDRNKSQDSVRSTTHQTNGFSTRQAVPLRLHPARDVGQLAAVEDDEAALFYWLPAYGARGCKNCHDYLPR